jgi:mRNA interferase RelE/StbE
MLTSVFSLFAIFFMQLWGKLKADGNFYRIRSGDYRLGKIIEGGTATFVRLLHRSEIYRYFP